MIKYINADLLRQEIERLYDGEAPEHDQQCDFDDGYFTGLATISNLIDSSLLEEKLLEDLEKAAQEYADKHGFKVPYDGSNNYYDDVDVKVSKEGFIAGAEWMANQKSLKNQEK